MKYLFAIICFVSCSYSFSKNDSCQILYNKKIQKIAETVGNQEKIKIYKEFILSSYPNCINQIYKCSQGILNINDVDPDAKAFAYYYLGRSLMGMEDYKRANDSLLISLEIYKSLNDTFYIAGVLHELGNANKSLHVYDKALKYYFESVKLNELLNNTLDIAYTYQNMGILYSDMEQYSLTKYYYKKALNIYIEKNDEESIASIYHNMGGVYSSEGNYNESLEYYNESLKTYERLKDNENIAITLINIGLVFELCGKYNESLENYQKAALMVESLGSKEVLCGLFFNLGSLYYNMDNLQKSKEYLNKSLELANQLSSPWYIYENYCALSNLHNELGNYKMALDYYKNYINIKDSILSEEKIKQIQEIEEEFQRDENRKKIEYYKIDQELKEAELKKKDAQNLVLIFSSSLGFFIVLVLVLFNYYQKKFSVKLYNEIQERKKTENQLKLLTEELEIRVKERTLDLENTNEKLNQEVNEHKKTLKMLNEAKNRAEEADKLKANFLANISHEIRTPMNAITGFAQMLTFDSTTNQKRKEYISLIKDSCSNLTNLIEDLVDFSNIEAGKTNVDKRDFNPHPIMEFLNDHYTSELVKRNKVGLVLVYDNENVENDLVINTDPTRLKQIVSIFLDNAIKFTEKGQINFGFTHSGNDKIQFYVKDTGIGIEDKFGDLIFERFRQIDESTTKRYAGAGIGLTIARNLSLILDGKIWYESVINIGSAFYFEFTSKISGEEVHFIQPGQYNWGDKVILIAEDKKINFEILKETLKETNAEVVWVKNGIDAVKFVESKKTLHLILMDIQMPEMDGFETTRQIKKIAPKIPIIAQTAYALPQDSFKCFDAGCNDYIAKPISLDKFLVKLDKFLSK